MQTSRQTGRVRKRLSLFLNNNCANFDFSSIQPLQLDFIQLIFNNRLCKQKWKSIISFPLVPSPWMNKYGSFVSSLRTCTISYVCILYRPLFHIQSYNDTESPYKILYLSKYIVYSLKYMKKIHIFALHLKIKVFLKKENLRENALIALLWTKYNHNALTPFQVL